MSNLCKVRRVKIKNISTVVTNKDGTYELIVDFTPAAMKLSRIMTDESELHRIIQHLNPSGVDLEGKYRYFSDIIVLRVGRSNKYKYLLERGMIKRDKESVGTIIVRTYADWEKKTVVKKEIFKHLIVNASHIRGQKAIFINTANGLYDKVDEILRCGIPNDTLVKYISKWTSYYGLQASNSTPVTMPKCIIIKDLNLSILDRVDIVKGSIKQGEKHFDVIDNQKENIPTCPFDGMGICDISIAERWSEDLGLDYIPGSFQIRLCGVKGCLFVMDVKKYITEANNSNSKMTDVDGTTFDYLSDEINVILTESMFKYGKFYNEERKAAQWQREFDRELYGYNRTFNICSFAPKKLGDEMLAAYQPLQSLPKLKRISELCNPTVQILKKMHTDIDKFLYYVGIKDYDDEHGNLNSASVPPYYQALYYNHSLVNDKYVRSKIENSLLKMIERSYTGKLYLKGNYTVVGSDPYALLQWAFSLDEDRVTGLLKQDEIYSHYWNNKSKKSVNVWRNPHIFTEHWIGSCVNNDEVNKWFKYLPTNTVVSIWDTNLLRMNSADCDGDIIATVDNDILCEEVARVLKNGEANTIYPDLKGFDISRDENTYSRIDDIQGQIVSEINGFKNDIGSCTNKISALWAVSDTQKYLKIMSVVDSLIIDFPKTSEKTDIPRDIEKYIKDNNVKKQKFMMYLPNNRKQREKEERRKSNEPALFSDDNCTMNRICNYMEKELSNVEARYNESEFDYKSLFVTVDSKLKYRPLYKDVSVLMKKFFRYQERINQERREDQEYSDKNKDYKALYTSFYSSCRDSLLKKHYSKNAIIDCCILCCYTEEYYKDKLSSYDLLWNMFPKELIQRAKGNCRNKGYTQRQIDAFNKSVEKHLEYATRQLKKHKEEKRMNRIKNIKCLQGAGKEFNIYKDEISLIKRAISTKTENYIRRRQLLYVLYVIEKKMVALEKYKDKKYEGIPYKQNSPNTINNSILAEILGIDDKKVKTDIQWLQKNGLCDVSDDKIILNTDSFLENEIDKSVIYYQGESYISAFKLKNRYLSR